MSAPPEWDQPLARFAAGEISAQIALAQLLLSGEPPRPDRLEVLAAEEPALRPLADLARDHGAALAPLAELAAGGLDPDGADMVAATAALFDRMAQVSPQAAVAFYSLGDEALLARATAELVAVIRDWAVVDGRDLLDVGCGIGRLCVALAPVARSVTGLDVSAAMVREGRARTAALPNVRLEQGSGRDLAGIADESVDAVIAADSFPYIVRAGLADRHLAEAARVLRPGGDLLVFNWSYRGDRPADVAEARALAAAYGFEVRRAGETPFTLWDAAGFHLRRC